MRRASRGYNLILTSVMMLAAAEFSALRRTLGAADQVRIHVSTVGVEEMRGPCPFNPELTCTRYTQTVSYTARDETHLYTIDHHVPQFSLEWTVCTHGPDVGPDVVAAASSCPVGISTATLLILALAYLAFGILLIHACA